MLDIEHLPDLYAAWRERHQDWTLRKETIAAVVRGDLEITDPDDEELTPRSPNMIQVALEDTAEASALMPTIRVRATHGGDEGKKKASNMERIGWGYFNANDMEIMLIRLIMDLGGFGGAAVTILPDFKQKQVLIERRDPLWALVEPGTRPGDKIRRAMFARKVMWTALSQEQRDKIIDALEYQDPMGTWDRPESNTEVVFIDYFDEQEWVQAALYESGQVGIISKSVPGIRMPVELDRVEHRLGICPVVVDGRLSLDGEFRGQFDQVISIQEGHMQLMSILFDYADQAVYSDIWVRDVIGEVPFGGGAFIELGPNGQIGRVPPAVSSLNVQQDLDQLMSGFHLGARWPKQRPGEIDQAIASAKFVEATTGIMNTAIRTYHLICRRMLERILRVAFLTDQKLLPGEHKASGVLRNQEYTLKYHTKDIDLEHEVKVDYGLGFGRDPAQSAVLHLQYHGANPPMLSRKTVMENVDGIVDVAMELARVDVEQLEAMAMAKLMQGLEAGMIPESALVEIAKAREKGEGLFELYEEYIVKPKEEQAAQMVPTGLGAPMAPGPPGMGAPPAPPGEEGLAPPAPPGGQDLLSRLNTPAGPGGMMGSQIMREG